MKSYCFEALQNKCVIKALFEANEDEIENNIVTICGWIRTFRKQKSFSFIEVNDGSYFSNLQIIADHQMKNYETIIDSLSTGTSLAVTGKIVKSLGKGQKIELHAEKIILYGLCPSDYPLQKKRHSFEFLRTIAHLRPRTNTQGAVARIRSHLAYAAHKFFQERGFIYLQAPIITGSDCEGAGELFQVTTLNLENLAQDEGPIDYNQDFFSKAAYLSVSGQLNGEAYALALSNIYTFGPTFRAENSHTSRHLAEFWMIEPEMAFTDLDGICLLAQDFLVALIQGVLTHCAKDLEFFNQFIEKGLIERLEHVIQSPFIRIPYSEAITLLKKSQKKFEHPVKWGLDLQSEHERYLSEEYFKKPLILTDYPKEIKAFYMRDNEDGKTVAAMDVLVPKIGEIIGGSQREERLDILKNKINKQGLNPNDYRWYLDLRRFATTPHGGFGLGFERFVQFITGIENIRDAIAFPRSPNQCDF